MGTILRDVKSKGSSSAPARPNRNALRWGGATRISDDASVMEVERRGSIRMDSFFQQLKRRIVKKCPRQLIFQSK